MLVTPRKEFYTSNTNCLLIKGHPNYWYKWCEQAMYTQQTTARQGSPFSVSVSHSFLPFSLFVCLFACFNAIELDTINNKGCLEVSALNSYTCHV